MPPNKFSVQKRRAIGKRLKALRTARDWSAQTLAVKADVSVGHYSCIERGEHSVSDATLGRLAKALEVSPESLTDEPLKGNGKNGGGRRK